MDSEPLEQLRFRDATRASSRLYAQGVRLLEHKDSVFRQFGLLRPSPSSPRAASSAATTHHQQRESSPAAGKNRRTPRAARERAASAPYASDRRAQSAGQVARTFSFRSTLESRALVSPKAKASASQHHHNYHRRPLSASAWTAASAKPGGSSASGRRVGSPRASAERPGYHSSSSKARAAAGGNYSTGGRPSAAPGHANSTITGRQTSVHPASGVTRHRHHQQHSPPQSARAGAANARRESITRDAGAASAHAGIKRPSVRIGVPTTFAGEAAPLAASSSAPVLIQVSRRTSSPIITPSVAEFGMRKRPSVSPIPSLQNGADGGSQAPQPRASILTRRDSKMERLLEQVTVLKASLGLSDEDLQWKVESTKGNAFLAAERHLNDGEERYDRLVYEVQLLSQTPCEEVSASLVKQVREIITQAHAIAESKPALAVCHSDVTRLKKEIQDTHVAAELQAATAGETGNSGGDGADAGDGSTPAEDPTVELRRQLEVAKTRILHVQEKLNDDISTLNGMMVVLDVETDRLAKTCAEFKFMSPEVADASAQLVAVLTRIPECAAGGEKLVVLCEQAIQAAQKLRGSRLRDLKRKEAELAKTMTDIEVWKTRRDQAKEFAAELAKREQLWRLEHAEDNNTALRLLRSHVPQDVQQLSIEAIIERAAQCGVLYTFDLAIYVKQNRFLHWLVTHESDVARDNFLAVECAAHFVNYTAYDVHELRALSAVLPLSVAGGFEFDKDGRKAEWKAQFLEHVYTLVKQQRGERVKAGWDPVRRARGEVQLQPLTDKQQLNAVYRYPSEQEIAARTAKFELQRKRLDLKREKLCNLEDELLPAAKAEYLAIAEDARSDELQRSFGKATLVQMRDDAKQALHALTKSRDVLKSEIAHSERQWDALCPTFTQFLDEVEKIRALDPLTRQRRIRGPFPSDIELKPRERAAFKKLSVEEEAQARKHELDRAIASRGKEISDAAAAESQVVSSPSDAGVLGASDSLAAASGRRGDSVAGAAGDANEKHARGGENGTPASSSSSSSTQPRSSFRRVKSLQVSTEVLQFLQQDFCSTQRVQKLAAASSTGGGGGASKAAFAVTAALKLKRFASEQGIDLLNHSAAEGSSGDSSSPPAAAAPVRPKSKALLKLLEKENEANDSSSETPGSEGAAAAPAAMRPLLSPMKGNMFSELQNRVAAKKKTSSSSSADGPESLSGELAASLSPAQAKPANFLEELKRKAARKEENSGASSSAASVQDLRADAPPPAPKSFLDELRARARSVD